MRKSKRNGTLRGKLKEGAVVLGVFCKTTSPEMIECLGYAGFDFCILDMEHGPIGIETLQNLVMAAELSGIAPIVRAQEISEYGVAHPLDVGAAGIQVPHVNSLADAEKVIALARFSPNGNRGVCRFVRAAKYSAIERNEYFRSANESLVVLQLEGSAINEYNKIVKLNDVDVFFIGPYDVSQTLGKIGMVDDPDVQDKIRQIIAIIKNAGKAAGIFVDTFEQAKRWIDMGVQYIAYSVDYAIFLNAAKAHVSTLKDLA